jgi:hypothetical protein
MDNQENEQPLWSKIVFWAIILFLILCFVAIATPNYIGPKRSGPIWERHRCIDNLREIDAAKNELALEHNLTNGTVVTVNQVTNYLIHGIMPKCPSGGIYIIGKIGETPICSIHGDVLPK